MSNCLAELARKKDLPDVCHPFFCCQPSCRPFVIHLLPACSPANHQPNLVIWPGNSLQDSTDVLTLTGHGSDVHLPICRSTVSYLAMSEPRLSTYKMTQLSAVRASPTYELISRLGKGTLRHK